MRYVTRLIAVALLCLAVTPASAFLLHATPGSGAPVTVTAPCDTTTGCPFAYSMSAKLVGSYGGKAFELVNETPTWVGTGTVAAGVFTVVTTSTGTPAVGNAVSTAGSGATPGFKPVTYISSGSGPYNLSDNSITIGSATAMATYAVLDVAFISNSWDPSTWQAFCYDSTCGVLKIFNEGSATATGALSGTDLIASEVNTGSGAPSNCSGSIIVCAPLFTIYAPTNTPIAQAVTPAVMATNAGVAAGLTITSPIAGTGDKSLDVAGLNLYTSACCGQIGIGDVNPSGIVIGSMFSEFFGQVSGTSVAAGFDIEGAGLVEIYDSGLLQHTLNETRYLHTPNTMTFAWNGTDIVTGAAPGTTVNTSAGFFNMGQGGDNTHGVTDMELAFMTADSASHSTAAGIISSYWSGRTPAACSGPLDFSWWQTSANDGPAAVGSRIGNGIMGWALRPLSAWYTGPIVNVTNNASQTKTFAAVGCNIDPALNAFCTGGNSPCLINTLYNQSWALGSGAVTGVANVRPTANNLDMTAAGANRPTIDYTNTLGGQPTIAFSGSQWMCTGSFVSAIGLSNAASYETDVVGMRTGNLTVVNVFVAGTFGGTQLDLPAIFVSSADTTQAASNDSDTSGGFTATDNHWHDLELKKNAGGTGGFFYVDGTANAESWTNSRGTSNVMCLGSQKITPITLSLTGNIAQVTFLDDTAILLNGDQNHAAAMLANNQAYYGVTFPH